MIDKLKQQPIKKITLSEKHKDVLDIQIYRRHNVGDNTVNYLMYVVSTNGVLVFPAIDKREDNQEVLDNFDHFAPTGFTDLNKEGLLLIDLA